jgi:sortase (surface protein transpeptidase)
MNTDFMPKPLKQINKNRHYEKGLEVMGEEGNFPLMSLLLGHKIVMYSTMFSKICDKLLLYHSNL